MPVGPHEPAGVDEPRQLVAGEERVLEARLAGDAGVARRAKDRAHEPLRIARARAARRAVLRVLVERGMALVVEVVQQRHVAPCVLVLAALARVGPHRGLDREAWRQQRLALRPLGAAAPTPRRGHARDPAWPRTLSCRPDGGRQEPAALDGESGYPHGHAIATRDTHIETLPHRGRACRSRAPSAPRATRTPPCRSWRRALLTAEPVTLEQRPAHPRRRGDARAARRPRRRGRVDRAEHACACARPSVPKTRLDAELCSASAPRSCSPARCWRASARPTCRRRAATSSAAAASTPTSWRSRRSAPRSTADREYRLRAPRGPQRRRDLPRRGIGDGHRERGHGRGAGAAARRSSNAACEPHVQDLCHLLCAMGATIEGIGSNVLTIARRREPARRHAPRRRRPHRGRRRSSASRP